MDVSRADIEKIIDYLTNVEPELAPLKHFFDQHQIAPASTAVSETNWLQEFTKYISSDFLLLGLSTKSLIHREIKEAKSKLSEI